MVIIKQLKFFQLVWNNKLNFMRNKNWFRNDQWELLNYFTLMILITEVILFIRLYLFCERFLLVTLYQLLALTCSKSLVFRIYFIKTFAFIIYYKYHFIVQDRRESVFRYSLLIFEPRQIGRQTNTQIDSCRSRVFSFISTRILNFPVELKTIIIHYLASSSCIASLINNQNTYLIS